MHVACLGCFWHSNVYHCNNSKICTIFAQNLAPALLFVHTNCNYIYFTAVCTSVHVEAFLPSCKITTKLWWTNRTESASALLMTDLTDRCMSIRTRIRLEVRRKIICNLSILSHLLGRQICGDSQVLLDLLPRKLRQVILHSPRSTGPHFFISPISLVFAQLRFPGIAGPWLHKLKWPFKAC